MGVIYAAVWKRTVSYLRCLPVIFRILIFCEFGILPIVKDWDLGFCPLLNFQVVIGDEKVIITFDFWSVESCEEKGDFLRVICTFSWGFDCTLINFVLVFGNSFSCNQGKWGYFWWFYTPFSYFCDWNTKSFHRDFASASWQATPKGHQLQSLEQI